MEEINILIDCLEKSPKILRELIKSIPKQKLKEQRKKGKWTIHENVCHLAQAELMINERFERLINETNPYFDPYIPGDTISDYKLITLNLNNQMDLYTETRGKTIDLLRRFDDTKWDSSAAHPQYEKYNARILLRHVLMHDHFHMYRIEESWLTKTDFL